MHDGKLAQKIDEAIRLDRQVRENSEQLKLLKKEIALEAGTRDDEQLRTDGGGWSWTMSASNGCICRVTQPAASLKSTIDGEGKTFDKIRDAAGQHFGRLFQPVTSYKPVAAFREEGASLLGRSFTKLLKLCSSETAAKVQFETKPEEARV